MWLSASVSGLIALRTWSLPGRLDYVTPLRIGVGRECRSGFMRQRNLDDLGKEFDSFVTFFLDMNTSDRTSLSIPPQFLYILIMTIIPPIHDSNIKGPEIEGNVRAAVERFPNSD